MNRGQTLISWPGEPVAALPLGDAHYATQEGTQHSPFSKMSWLVLGAVITRQHTNILEIWQLSSQKRWERSKVGKSRPGKKETGKEQRESCKQK